jgi:putative Holliday junction resolvase
MAVIDLLDIPAAIPHGAPLAGLDLGTKTIGVAISDTSLMIASPLALIRREKFTQDAEALFALMAQRGAAGLVIGLPVNMDGTEGPRCQSARAFARNLLRLSGLPIAFWDERLSSVAVNRVLIDEADATRARRAQVVDKMAATWILQGALERLRAAASPPKVPL